MFQHWVDQIAALQSVEPKIEHCFQSRSEALHTIRAAIRYYVLTSASGTKRVLRIFDIFEGLAS